MRLEKYSMRLVSAFLVLALVCACGGLAPRAEAMLSSLDPAKPGSITVRTPEDMPKLKDVQIPVAVVPFADVDVNVNYTLRAPFVGRAGIPEDINIIKSYREKDSSVDLKALAEALKTVVMTEGFAGEKHSCTVQNGSGSVALPVPKAGLYLILPSDVEDFDTKYSFEPFVVAVPNGEKKNADDPDSDWVYDITAVLKAEATPTFGSLKITKDLISCNTTVGGADVVFKVVGTKVFDEESQPVEVYNNLITLHFDAPGLKSYTISHLPIGTNVTVKEIYDGFSYTIRTANPKSAVVSGPDGPTAEVRFENEYDHHAGYSTSVTNNFRAIENHDGEYYHYQVRDSVEALTKGEVPENE